MRAHVQVCGQWKDLNPRSLPLSTRQSNEPEITGVKLASKMSFTLFAFKLQQETTSTTTECNLLAVY